MPAFTDMLMYLILIFGIVGGATLISSSFDD